MLESGNMYPNQLRVLRKQHLLSQKQLARYKQIFLKGAKAEDYTNFCQMGPFERMSISRSLYNLARKEMTDLS